MLVSILVPLFDLHTLSTLSLTQIEKDVKYAYTMHKYRQIQLLPSLLFDSAESTHYLTKGEG